MMPKTRKMVVIMREFCDASICMTQGLDALLLYAGSCSQPHAVNKPTCFVPIIDMRT